MFREEEKLYKAECECGAAGSVGITKVNHAESTAEVEGKTTKYTMC